MKAKKIISLLLAANFMFANIPTTVFAAEKSQVTNVTATKGWDLLRSRYITYTINGVKYDSREMAASTNMAAYNAMSDSDKEKVARWMAGAWPSGRIRQFGEAGADVLIDKYNTVTNWKKLWEETDKKIENYYSGDLLYVYGGPSTSEPQKYYEQELERLNTLAPESTAYKAFNGEYADTFQVRVLYQEREYIGQLMGSGLGYYKQLSQNMRMATQAAIKGSSKELISIICDKMITPVITPRSMFSTIEKEVFSGVLEISDKITGVTGQIQDTVLGEPISGSGASKLISQFKTLAQENYNAAKLCHDQAVTLYGNLNRDADKYVKEAEAARSHRAANGRDGEVEAYKTQKQAVDDKYQQDIYDLVPDTSKANAIYNMYPKSYLPNDEDHEEYLRLYRAAQAAEQNARQQMYNDVSSWSRSVHSAARAILDEAGMIPLKKGTEITDTIREMAPGAYFVGTTANGEEYIDGYQVFPYTKDTKAANLGKELLNYNFKEIFGNISQITPEEFEQIMEDKDDYLEYLDRRYKMYEAITYSADALIEAFYSKDLSLTAKLKGWNVGHSKYGGIYITKLPQDWAAFIDGDYYYAASAEGVISSLNDKTALWGTEDTITDVNNNFLWLTEMYEKATADQKCYEEAAKLYADRFKIKYKDWMNCETAKLNFAESGLPSGAYAQADNAGGTIRVYADGESEGLTGYTPQQYANMAGTYKAAYEKYYELEDKADIARLELDFIFESMRSSMLDASQVYAKFDSETKEAIDDVWNKEYNNVYGLSSRASTAVGYLNTLWRDFDSKSSSTMDVKKKLDKYTNESGSMKRRIISGSLTKQGLEYTYTKGIAENIAYAKEHSYMAANMVTNGKAVDMEAQANALFDEMRALFDDPSAYTPVTGIEATSNTDISLDGGNTQTLSAAVTPSDASDKRIIWESLDPDIAVVDENGKVTAVSGGTATIRAYAADSEKTALTNNDYTFPFSDTYEPLSRYITEFTITVDGGKTFMYGDATADNILAADDAAAILQKVLLDSYKMPIEENTDSWLRYADTTADGILAADDATAVMQKVLVDSYVMPCENK